MGHSLIKFAWHSGMLNSNITVVHSQTLTYRMCMRPVFARITPSIYKIYIHCMQQPLDCLVWLPKFVYSCSHSSLYPNHRKIACNVLAFICVLSKKIIYTYIMIIYYGNTAPWNSQMIQKAPKQFLEILYMQTETTLSYNLKNTQTEFITR